MSDRDAIAALRQIAKLDDTTQRPEEDIDALYHNERTLREVVWSVRAFLKAYDAALPPQVSPELIAKLGKLGTYLTEQGEYEACDLIDTVVERLTPKAKG